MTAVRITGIAAGGDGIARLADGRVAFVPRAAPGDLVQLRLGHAAKRFVRARIAVLEEPGPDRVTPPCRHYERDECGGCQLMHLAAPAQRAARSRIAGDALRRLGRLDVEDPPLVPAAQELGYRMKLVLHPSADGRRVGLHVLERPDRVFALEECLLAAPPVRTLWQALRPHQALLPPSLASLALRADAAGGVHVIAVCRDGRAWTEAPALLAALRARGQEAVLWWQPAAGAARVVAGGDGEAYPATVFEQVHPVMGRAARAHALAALGTLTGVHAWDLYAGIGETTTALRAAGATVESVEVDARAVAFAERTHPLAPAEGVRHVGRVEVRLPQLRPAAAGIVNPPRGGLDPAAVAELGRRGPARLAYISCDPATLARDLRGLLGAYRLREVTAFDLFPQTAHVESVAALERR